LDNHFEWEIVNVYGLAQDDRKMEFILELQTEITNTQGPILLGGDFNLVRRVAKKSFGNVEVRFIYAFNNMIDTT